MASTLIPPPPSPPQEKEAPISDHNGNGSGGGNIDFPDDHRRWDPDPDPERWATPLSAYRTAGVFVIISIMSIFATLTRILALRWVHSKDWVTIALPHILYINTVILLASSVTIELARAASTHEKVKRCQRWLIVSLLLGLAFLVGQLTAWRQLVSRGLFVASNPGSFFFYLLTGIHGVHLLVGILALVYLILFAVRLARRNRQKTAVGVIAYYWHFLDGLWLYVFALLIMAIQR